MAWKLFRETHLADINSTPRISLTPPIRHESIWHTSIASSCKSCLNPIYKHLVNKPYIESRKGRRTRL